MSDLSPELNLALAVDDDDTADYLDAPTNSLRSSLLVLDGLFNATTGHNHSGSHQGGALQFQDLSVGRDLNVVGASTLHGPVHAYSNLIVDGDSTLNTLTVNSTTHLVGALTIDGAINSGSTLTVTTDLTVGRNLRVNGATTLVGLLTLQGGLTASGTLAITGAASISSNLTVGGAATISGVITGLRLVLNAYDGGNVLNVGGNAVASGYFYNRSGAGRCWDNIDFTFDQAASGGTLVQRDGNGYVNASYINYTGGGVVAGGKPTHVLGRSSVGDTYLRWWPTSAIGPPISSWYVQANITCPALSNNGGNQDATFSAVVNQGGFGVSGTIITLPRPGYYAISGGLQGNNLTGNQEQLEIRLFNGGTQLDFMNSPLKITSYWGGYFSWQGFCNAGDQIHLNFRTSFDSISGSGEIIVAFIPTADYNQ